MKLANACGITLVVADVLAFAMLVFAGAQGWTP